MIKKANIAKLLALLTFLIITPFMLIEKSLADSTSKPTILEFTSPMCSACNQLKQVLPSVESKYSGQIDIKKYNADSSDSQTKQLMSKYDVNFVPKLIFIDKNGKVVRMTQGFLSESQLDTYFQELISK